MKHRLYLCAPAAGDDLLRAALRGGVEILQLRDAALDDEGLLREGARLKALADEAGAAFVLNDRPDLARELGAGVHLGQDDGDAAQARAQVGPGVLIGRSTHEPTQGAAADVDPDVDYVSIGPVWATPTKPGRAPTGLDYVRWADHHVQKPWFAIGGVDTETVYEAIGAGATRAVVVRAILEAADPEAAARSLHGALHA